MKRRLYLVLMLAGVLFLGLSCNAVTLRPPETTPAIPVYYDLPTEDGMWVTLVSHEGRQPTELGAVTIDDIGEFTFSAIEVDTVRPDVFQEGHFSLFDILVHLVKRGDITFEYHFDETMQTHVIDTINGESGWWYRAHYSGGWFESNAFRMDMYPYKDESRIRFFKVSEETLATIYQSFKDEIARLEYNRGEVIITEVIIDSQSFHYSFKDVVVTAHGVRHDVLQPGVVTALDTLLSLAEQGEISRLRLTWYERIATADQVDRYSTERID